MAQSGFIAALLLAGFVLYLAANKRLQTYASVLWGKTAAPTPSGGGSSGGLSLGSIAGTVAKDAAEAAVGIPPGTF